MNERITHYVGSRAPSLYGTITLDGVAVDFTQAPYTGATVKLQMRAVASSTLDVDAAAVIETPAAGGVRYDWASGDVDTAGIFAAWWEVTLTDTRIFETPEFQVELLAHAAAGNEYVSVLELKETLSLSGSTFADADLAGCVTAASRAVDGLCDTRFYPGSPGEVRKYSPVSEEYLLIHDASAITAVSANGSALVLDTDYGNFSAAPGYPTSVLRSLNGFTFPRGMTNSVSVTGTFGWASPPADVKRATMILASRLLKRSREAAFGVIGFDLEGGAVRIPGRDPDVERLLAPYMRSSMIE